MATKLATKTAVKVIEYLNIVYDPDSDVEAIAKILDKLIEKVIKKYVPKEYKKVPKPLVTKWNGDKDPPFTYEMNR